VWIVVSRPRIDNPLAEFERAVFFGTFDTEDEAWAFARRYDDNHKEQTYSIAREIRAP